MDKNKNDIVRSSFWSSLFNSSGKRADIEDYILSIPIFKDLSSKEILQLTKIMHNRNYLPGECIFFEGDPGIAIYIIRSGEVVIKRNIDAGGDHFLATFGKGDFFGELALVDSEKRSASAIAKTDVKLTVIFKLELDEFIEKFPKKGIKILQGITEIVVTRLKKLNEENILLQTMLKIKSEEDYGA
jgi:CRP-like cAMP-binding protein